MPLAFPLSLHTTGGRVSPRALAFSFLGTAPAPQRSRTPSPSPPREERAGERRPFRPHFVPRGSWAAHGRADRSFFCRYVPGLAEADNAVQYQCDLTLASSNRACHPRFAAARSCSQMFTIAHSCSLLLANVHKCSLFLAPARFCSLLLVTELSRGPPTVDCGLWSVDCGLWPVDCGLWPVDWGLWPVD